MTTIVYVTHAEVQAVRILVDRNTAKGLLTPDAWRRIVEAERRDSPNKLAEA